MAICGRSMTFRQEVEEIECSYCSIRNGCTPVFKRKECPHINAICEAANDMAKRMPKPNPVCECDACWAARKKLVECQDHIIRETKG